MKKKLINEIIKTIQLDNTKDYTILDFGCGNGDLLHVIQSNLNNKSQLIGINSFEAEHQKTDDKFKEIDFQIFKFIDHFNFPDEHFDLVISVDTLECIPNKKALLEEVNRILKPKGKVLFAHWDWDTQIYNTSNKEIIRKFVHNFADWEQGWMDTSDGMMGRKLWGYFESSKMFTGEIMMFNLIEKDFTKGNYGFDRLKDIQGLINKGKINQDEYDLVTEEMTKLYNEKKYLYSLNSYIYYGEKLGKGQEHPD